MPTTTLPPDKTKVSYILPKADKRRLERAAGKAEMSMSQMISDALVKAGILTKWPSKRKAG